MNEQIQSPTTQNKNLTDFAQGDPDAGNAGNYRNNVREKSQDLLFEDETTSSRDNNKKEPNPEEGLGQLRSSDSSHHNNKQTSQTDCEEYEPFNPYSEESLADLRKESKSLLSVNSSNLTLTTLDLQTEDYNNNNKTSIFELRWDDRKRIARLISELATAHEKIQQLESRLTDKEIHESKYKEKCSDLMKKVDVLNEKNYRLENEKAQIKEKHLESLKTLNNKVALISDRFEQSAIEIEQLTAEKSELKSQNQELKTAVSLLERKVKAIENSQQKTKNLYDAAVSREKALKDQIRTISVNLEQKIKEEEETFLGKKKVRDSKELDYCQFKTKIVSTSSPIVQQGYRAVGKSFDFTKEIHEINVEELQPVKPNTKKCSEMKVKENQHEEALLQDLFFKF